jgi:hypothetical protein
MIGITLTPEQIRAAPPEVRRWVEREVMALFGQPSEPAEEPHSEHLAVCTAAHAGTVLAHIQSVLPVVNVFFELGRQGVVYGQANIESFRLLDIVHHTRLKDVNQVIACLDIINQAYSNACGDVTARFCALDREGHCFVAVQTQQNILRLWQKVVASQQLVLEEDPEAAPEPGGATGAAAEAAPGKQPFDGKEVAAG